MSYYRHLILSDPYITSQVAHYPFDTNANDLINAYNGTSNNISYANVGANGAGGSATFNGINSTVNVPNPASNDFSFDTGAFSINMWVYIPTGGVGGTYLTKRDTTFNEWTIFHNVATSQLIWTQRSTSGGSIGRTATIAIPFNVWNMITITFSGGLLVTGIKIYLNRNLLTATNQVVAGYTGNNPTGCRMLLGRQGNNAGTFITARIDNTRIWKGRELNATEITDMYNTFY